MSFTAREKEDATGFARTIEVELKLDRRLCDAPLHVSSAAIVAKLLLVAADAHRGDENSFTEMARRALMVIRTRVQGERR